MLVFLYMVILMELSFMQAVADGRREKPESNCTALRSTISPKKLRYCQIHLLPDFLWGMRRCLFDYSRCLSGAWFSEYHGSIDGLFGGSHPLRDIYSCCDKIRNNKGSSCVYRCYTDCIAWADSHLSGVPSRHEVDSVLFIQNTSNVTVPIILGIVGIGIFLISMTASIRIFVNKEL